MCYINSRSLKNKTLYLNDYITTHKYDLVAFTKTWFNSTDNNESYINALVPDGYAIQHVDRDNGQRGGGVALIHRTSIILKKEKMMKFTQFEVLMCLLKLNNKAISIFIIYRPPPTQQNGLSATGFLDEFAEFISKYTVTTSENIITGDINIHLDVSTNSHTRQFEEILESCSLHQYINVPTHYKGHTLDILVSRDTNDLICNVDVVDIGLCDNDGNLINDHFAITCNIKLPVPTARKKLVHYRKLKNIVIEDFRSDIQSSTNLNTTTGSLEELIEQYMSGLRDLVDVHAPLISRTLTPRPHAAWYDEELRDAKQTRRKLERKWRRSEQQSDHAAYRKQCAEVAKQLNRCKTHYYSNRVEECHNDQKSLFKITDTLLVNQHQSKLPTYDDETLLANNFCNFFHAKIETIRANFNSEDLDRQEESLTDMKFRKFRPTTLDEIRALILSCNNSSCLLDPVPTWPLKDCIDDLLPLLTVIVNKSITLGNFPELFKNAIVKPHLKNEKLDPEELKHYRPVSNINFLSKIIEKCEVKQLEEFMHDNNLFDPFQSAYRSQHATETAILKINNDILSGLDRDKCTVLASLDLSAAFDTVDYAIFLRRLQNLYGVEQLALQWFTSYLTGRTHQVCINNTLSEPQSLQCGVPQGSVHGTRLYSMYVYLQSSIIVKHNLLYHSYADDTQIYLQCDNTDDAIKEAINQLEKCIADVCSWMKNNSLKINEDKTEFIIFHKNKELTIKQIHITSWRQ